MAVPTVEEVRTLEFTRVVAAPIAEVWRAFTNRDEIADWLSYDASINVEEGGHFFVRWYEGPHAYGSFLKVEENSKLKLTWHDGITNASKVKVIFTDDGDSTSLTLKHFGIEADERAEHYTEFWNMRLDNLKSILETGANKTITDRIIIGILGEGVEESNGATRDSGVRVTNIVEGYSAEAAGIKVGDIIYQVDDTEISALGDIGPVTRNKQPGDTVTVYFDRDGETHSVPATLRGYPIPEMPATFSELADRFDQRTADLVNELKPLLATASEELSAKKPDDDAMSLKESLAHFILTARHTTEWLGSYLNGPRIITPYTRYEGRMHALIAVHDSNEKLLAELKRSWAEVSAILRLFPDSMLERKNNMWWIVFETAFQPILFRNRVEALKAVVNA